ncbi:hypothetical protein [Thioalkalivibrio sp. HK1]|uniref:hypothetical protein n=1 Tax=Thioalkalivibrio sp. HK1 TaxID=1469245 RepID=UPI00046E92A5|nr:hypothetical protein [Thioalkalivibrio sp. HK1]
MPAPTNEPARHLQTGDGENSPAATAPSELKYSDIASLVEDAGLDIRGAFHPLKSDGVPPFSDGRSVATLFLIGNEGRRMWPFFTASKEARDHQAHPLDRFSRRIVSRIAARLEAVALFPFDGPPWLPFLRWAQKAGPLFPSPIGPLIHPVFGLWHAFRGALGFHRRIELPAADSQATGADDDRWPCRNCIERPCLKACPAEAFASKRYDADQCTMHLRSDAGKDCVGFGCLARRACPIGKAFTYSPSQSEFHTRAFLAAAPPRRSDPSASKGV